MRLTNHCISRCLTSLALTLLFSGNHILVQAAERPNVILIITDDQGYGDVAAHGNKVIKTPALDKLHSESVRLTDYHVDPTCAPTRSALMTGRYSTRTGVWHTIQGRSLLDPREVTLAQVLGKAGYRTGMFGKWHLGDNYPSRPQDLGFQHVLAHGGGGVGQTPDYFRNNYFEDTYFLNGHSKKYEGYCTDVWFDGALQFIEQNKEQPFFAYISTNAPHGPYLVAEKYSQPYKDAGIKSPQAEFFGMITNIDENVGKLRAKLTEWGIAENTLLIFTTDNGTAAGARNGGFNAGMRGQKGSEYEGGHRVPCFLHWPAGNLKGGRDEKQLCAHIDVLPTLADFCGVKLADDHRKKLDGESLAAILQQFDVGGKRSIVVHSQRIEFPEKWRKSAVMQDHWRLINGKELYDLSSDPGQQKNVAAENPDTVADLRGKYEQWWKHISHSFDEYVNISLGNPAANPAYLTCHDWHEPKRGVPWNQNMVMRDQKSNGFWAVDVERDGTYEITLRDRPFYEKHALEAGTAKLQIGDVKQEQPIIAGKTGVTFTVQLKKGPTRLQTWLNENGKECGAYFVDVRRVE